MRSSKNRSRSKGNRNRSVGNVVNRVFDSSGPEGKVRGTPQQIIDKYNQLARDAQLGNDRVAAENFQQHAEHYLRLLAEAQREQDARREQQQQQQNRQDSQGGQGGQGGGQQPRGDQGERGGQETGEAKASKKGAGAKADTDSTEAGGFDAVIDTADSGDSGLVETPESAPKPKRARTRRPRKQADAAEQGNPDTQPSEGGPGDGPATPPQEAAE